MSTEFPQINKVQIGKVIDLCVDYSLKEDIHFPEEQYVESIKNYGARLGRSAFAANAIFLTTSLIRGGNTSIFFSSLHKRDQYIPRYYWLFEPKIVSELPEHVIQEGCWEFFRPQGYATDALRKWKYNCQLLFTKYDSDIRNLFKLYGNDTRLAINAISGGSRIKTAKKIANENFRGYGEKLAQLAVQWLHKYGLYTFNNIEASGFPVDFQVMRMAIQTKQVTFDKPLNTFFLGQKILEPAISRVSAQKHINPREVQEIIWHIGNTRCNKELHVGCPLYEVCSGVLKSNKYQREGKIDPGDLKSFK